MAGREGGWDVNLPSGAHVIRLCRIVTRLNVGGPARQVLLLARGLEQERFETVVITGRLAEGEAGMYEEARRLGVRLEVVPELGREVDVDGDLLAFGRVFRLLRKYRPQVVHTHLSKAGLVGRLAAHTARVPAVVHTFHGHVLSGYFGKVKTRMFLELERQAARWSHALVALSESQKQELAHRFRVAREEKFRVVPLGFEHLEGLSKARAGGRLRGELRAELGLEDRHVLVGTVGRMVPIKNHELFVRAAALVAEARPECRFLVVGDGPERRRIEALAAELGLGDRFRMLGWRRDLERIYADLDLFVLEDVGTCTADACLAQSIAGGTSDEQVRFHAEAGRAYFIVVDGYDGSVSDYSLSVRCRARPPFPSMDR